MTWINVTSSNIESVRYYEGDLLVKFKTGAQYRYFNVPVTEYDKLLNAESCGKFLNKHIKGTYLYNKTSSAQKVSDKK